MLSWRLPLKILYLNINGTLGGAELCLLDVLASLRQARPDWGLEVLLGDDGPLRTEVERLGAVCRVLPLPKAVAKLGDAGLRDRSGRPAGRLALAARAPLAAGPAAAYLAGLRKTIRQAGPDLVQSNSMKTHVLGAWATPGRVPLIWHLHDYVASRAVMAKLLRLSSRRRLLGVAVSRSVADDASKALGAQVPIQTIYNAIDLVRFAPGPGDGPALDEAAGLPAAEPGTVRVGLVATFARWKGHDVFLEAASKIPANRPCRFYIVGGPIYRSLGSQWSLDELRSRASSLGLDGRLGFTGFQEPASAMRSLDVVVHASTRPEPFGRVIVEAMACARAVVAIRDGGSGELFEDGVEALGCPPDDPSALAVAIDRLVGDPDLRRRLGEAGHRAALARFDRAGLADSWAEVYRLAGCGSATPPPT